MENEKVKEIKKALENCQKNNCLDCPYFIDEKRCRANDLLLDAITLINELESENAYKQEHIELWFKKNEEKKKRIAELEKELTNDRVFYKDGICYPMNCQGALKQFAERLKEKYGKSCSEYYPLLLELTSEQLDETLKEFINE